MLAKNLRRLRRKNKIRYSISWTASRPRLTVFRSNLNIYAQVIDDEAGKTIAAFSDIKMDKWTKIEKAEKVWEEIAKKASENKVKEVVFDKNGFSYHGRVKALADAARKAGLQF